MQKSFDPAKEFLPMLCCPVCQNNLRYKKIYLFCNNCQREYPNKNGYVDFLIEENLTPDLALTIKKWEQEYITQIKRIKHNTYVNSYLESSLTHILKFFKSKGRFLEAGCGLGENLEYIGKKGALVFGIDISKSAVEYANKRLRNNNIKGLVVRGDILSMPYKSESFDFIYSGGTIEHFENTAQALRELRRILKTKGSLNLTVPNISLATIYLFIYGNIPNITLIKTLAMFIHIKLLKGKYAFYGYEKSFTSGQIKKLLKQAGFSDFSTGPLESFWHVKMFSNSFLKEIVRKLAKQKLFWPMIYANAKK